MGARTWRVGVEHTVGVSQLKGEGRGIRQHPSVILLAREQSEPRNPQTRSHRAARQQVLLHKGRQGARQPPAASASLWSPPTVSGELIPGYVGVVASSSSTTPSATEKSASQQPAGCHREGMSASRAGASSPDAHRREPLPGSHRLSPSSTARAQSLSSSSRELPWSSTAEPLYFVRGFIHF